VRPHRLGCALPGRAERAHLATHHQAQDVAQLAGWRSLITQDQALDAAGNHARIIDRP
jgi:hypothetical protein